MEAGSINVDSMGFQNGFQSQIEQHGFDIVLRNSADDHSSIKNCRTESACFIDSDNVANAAGDWTAGHAYPQGAITRGRTGGNGNGHVHIAMSGGTSGASEPQWPGSCVLATGTIAAGTDTLSVSDPALNKETAKSYGVIVYGAGKDGAPLYSTQNLAGIDQVGNQLPESRTVDLLAIGVRHFRKRESVFCRGDLAQAENGMRT